MIGGNTLNGRRKWLLLCAAGLGLMLVAIVQGWNARGSLASHGTPPPPDAWQLPKPHGADAEADAAILRARRPWGGSAAFRDIDAAPAGAQGTPADQPWRFVGTVVRDNEAFALIEIGKELKYLRAGDPLPDSSTVMQIEQDTVVIRGAASAPAGLVTYRLFHKNS